MKNQKNQHRGRGFTMVELVVTMSLLVIMTLIVGILLVSGQKNWNFLFGRVYRQEAIDAYAARTIFDNVSRKASSSKAILGGSKNSLELFYWDTGSVAETPENYAKFYVSGDNLIVEHGRNQPGTWTPDTNSPAQSTHIAAHVKNVQFDVLGASVQMLLYYTDTTLTPVVCSAIRQNF